VPLSGYTVHLYATDDDAISLDVHSVDRRFGPLSVATAGVEDGVPADEAIVVAIAWLSLEPAPLDYKLALSLVDDAGRTLLRRDLFLLDERGQGTSQWPPGGTVEDDYVLPLALGLAPRDYVVTIGLYHESEPEGLDLLDAAGAPAGKSLPLARVTLAPPAGRTSRTLDVEYWGLSSLDTPALVANGLWLDAYAFPERTYRNGETLPILLAWRADDGSVPAEHAPVVELVRDGRLIAALAAAPAGDAYPTSDWAPGEVVLDWRDVRIPPETGGGAAMVQVRVPGQTAIVLGELMIESVPRLLTAPTRQVEIDMPLGQAVLIGYDLDDTDITAGKPFEVTLYWRAKGTLAVPRTVFCHLLSQDGRLVAQHDGPPALGERPTTGWVNDEYIVDPHLLDWVDPAYVGPAVLEVGLYDPVTSERLLNLHGDSRLLLPSSIIVR